MLKEIRDVKIVILICLFEFFKFKIKYKVDIDLVEKFEVLQVVEKLYFNEMVQ